MPDKKRRNIFEEHIESEDFDVSELGSLSSLAMSPQLVALLDSLPQPLDYRIWDEYLDERQKMVCAQLTIEIIDRVMREQFSQDVMQFSDDELIYMLTVPIALAMLAEDKLHHKPPVPEDDLGDLRLLTKTDEKDAPAHHVQNPEWANVLGQFVRDVGHYLRRLFRRH